MGGNIIQQNVISTLATVCDILLSVMAPVMVEIVRINNTLFMLLVATIISQAVYHHLESI